MNKKGFTFVEIAVGLAILAIISAIALPSYFSWLPRYRLQTSVRQIYDDMNMAKSRAVRTNSDVGIAFNSNNENYSVFIDTDQDQILDGGETVIGNGTLENGVDIIQTTFAANTYGFNSRGMAAGTTGDVRLTNPSGLFMGVRVNIAGGLTIISSPDGGMTWP